MARIFISHSSANRGEAISLAESLRCAGFPELFLDVEDLYVGQDWERRLYEEIAHCDVLLILLTSQWQSSKWCFAEFTQARAFGKPVLPLMFERDVPHPFAPQIQRLAYWDQRERARALSQLCDALAEISLESGGGVWPPEGDPERSPYPGLLPFEEQDSPVFHGRETEIRAVLEHLHARRMQWGQALLVLHGSSGVGKSSLLRAGVIPRLKRLRQQWIVLPTIRPHPDPCEGLAVALAIAFKQEGESREWTAILQQLQEAGTESDLAIVWKTMARDLQQARGANDARILIPIDQGEELLSGQVQTSVARPFYLWLAAALKSDQPFQVLMALQSDSMGRLREESGLGDRMAGYLLPQLPLESIAALIERPAEAAGLTVDRDLTAQARDDTAQAQALPLLACVLRVLHARHCRERRITIRDYEALGNRAAGETPLARVVSEKADAALAHLQPNEKPTDANTLRDLRLAFLMLVRIDDDRLIRRPALLGELPAGSHPLLRQLAAAHLIVIDEDSRRVEVTHDSLLEHWPRLKHWLQEAREFLITRSLLEDELRLWQQAPADRKTTALLSGLKLEKAREWLDQLEADGGPALTAGGNDDALKRFVEASDREARREERRERLLRRWLFRLGWGSAALFLAASAVTGWLLQRARTAQASSYVSLHQAQLDGDPLQSVIHGLAAFKRHGFRSGTSLQLAASLQEALRRPLAITPLVSAHQKGITSLAIVSEREWISGGADGRVRRWRESTPLSATRSGAAGSINALVVLTDGDWISAGDDGSLVRWREGLPMPPLLRPDAAAGEVVSLVALPDGGWVSGSARGELVLWRGERPLRTLAPAARDGNPSAQGRIWSLATGRNGRWASGGSNGRWQLWDRNGRRVGKSVQTGQGQIFALLLRADGSLVSGGSDGSLRFWGADGQPLGVHRGPDNSSVWGLAELANGELLSSGRYGALQRWRDNAPVGEPLQTGHRGQWSLVGSADGRTVVTYGETVRDDRFQAWRLVAGTEASRYVPGGGLWSVAPGGTGELVSGWRDGGLRQGLAGPLRGDMRGEGIWQLERLRNGDLISIGTEGGLRRWPAQSLAAGSPGLPAWGQLIEHGAGPLLSVREHRDGWLLGDRQGRLWYWRGGKPSERPLFTGGSPLFSLVSLGDGWVSGWGDGRLRIHQQGQLQTVDSGQPEVLSLAVLPDGEWLSGGSDGSLQRWRRGRRAGKPFPSGQTAVWNLVPLADGQLLSIGEEGLRSTARLISPRWVAELACHELADNPVLWQRDGAAEEAASLCGDLQREQARPPSVRGDGPLRPLLQRAAGPGKTQATTITLKDGRRLQWLPQPLTRRNASSLVARFLVDGQQQQAELNCRLGYWQTLPGGPRNRPDTSAMRQLIETICSRLDGLPDTGGSRGRGQALLFDPPSLVRQRPNGEMVCLLPQPQEITVLGVKGLWLHTDACGAGRQGVIHRSLVRF